MVFDHIIFGLIAIALGTAGIKYNYRLVAYTGHIDFVERYLGYGSTYAFLKIMGVLLCFGGFLYMFGLMGPVENWLLSPLKSFFHASSK